MLYKFSRRSDGSVFWEHFSKLALLDFEVNFEIANTNLCFFWIHFEKIKQNHNPKIQENKFSHFSI